MGAGIRRPSLLAAACVVVWSLPATAQEAAAPPLALGAAITEALDRSPALAPQADAVTLAEIRQHLAASAFSIKITPSVAETTDPIGGTLHSAGMTVTKALATGGQAFVNVQGFAAADAGSGFRSAQYTVGMSQPLLRGFRETATADLVDANRGRTSAGRALATARATLVVDVTRRYFAVIKAQRLLAVANASASRAQALVAASRARTSVGLATELDVLRAQVQESQVASTVAAATTSLASAEDDLATILGRPLSPAPVVDAAIDVAAIEQRLPSVPEAPEDLVALAIATRPEVQEARDKVADAARAADVARWNLAPPIALDVSYTQRSLTMPGVVALGSLTSGWHVGLSTTYSIDRSAGTAALGTARVASAAADRAVSEETAAVEADVRRTHRAWRTAIATVAIEQEAVRLAERERELANVRLERGLGTTLDVVAAEDSLLQAQTAAIGAELDRTLLAVDLRRAVGVLTSEMWWS